jgi:hypothetical protein
LIDAATGISRQEIEGETTLVQMKIPGDLVLKKNAKEEQYLADIGKIMRDELETPVTFTFKRVDRKVIVFRGKWNFTPVDATAMNELEIYGDRLNAHRLKFGGGGRGDIQRMARWMGSIIDKQVLVEVENSPAMIRWHANDEETQLTDADPKMMLDHIGQQTGLTWTEETRNVRRLFVERAAN